MSLQFEPIQFERQTAYFEFLDASKRIRLQLPQSLELG